MATSRGRKSKPSGSGCCTPCVAKGVRRRSARKTSYVSVSIPSPFRVPFSGGVGRMTECGRERVGQHPTAPACLGGRRGVVNSTSFYYYRDHRSSEWFNTSAGHCWEGKMTAAESAASARASSNAAMLCDFCKTVELVPWQNQVELEALHSPQRTFATAQDARVILNTQVVPGCNRNRFRPSG